MLLVALFSLLLCQLVGEMLSRGLHIPIPGPVLGMLLLTGWYGLRRREPGKPMRHASDSLLRWLGLLFVPAGVGIVANLSTLRANWLPITVGLVGSTLITLLTAALTMQWLTRSRA